MSCASSVSYTHLLLERPEETIGGLKMLADIMGVQTAIIAIEENKKDTFAKIEEPVSYTHLDVYKRQENIP